MTISDAWPAQFQPEKAPVHVRNEIRSAVPAAALWKVLIRATEWPEWYPHASQVEMRSGTDTLSRGSVFRWRTLNVRVTTTVTEFEPALVLAWSGTGPASRGYHRWVLTPADDGGRTVVTEEVQTGLVPRLLASRITRDLKHHHQEWLEGLVARAAAGDTA